MVNLSINGKTIRTKSGKTLFEVAKENDIYIPSLCYDNRLSPTGACRLCIVEINDKGFFTSCTTTAKDGMKITVSNDKLEKARAHILKYLSLECDTHSYDLSYQCQLKELLLKYGIHDKDTMGLFSLKDELKFHSDTTSPILIYASSKCIKCFKCIKACDEIQGKNVLSFAGRGINKYIVAGLGVWSESECDGCGECIQICPTGAIIEKPQLEILKKTKPDIAIESTCPYCGVGCRIKVEAINNNIVRVHGMEGVKPNKGRLCIKGRFGYDFTNSNHRLTKPLIKINGHFEELEWDNALDFVASKLNEIKLKYGNNALAGYSSGKCTNEDNYIFQKFVRIAFGTNNVDYCTRLCHASTVAAMMKAIGSGAGCNSIEDYETADCIIVIGNNMVETHPVTATFVKHGISTGTKLIIIDPKWTPLVGSAEVWLQPKLGTDIPLINGIIKMMIDRNLVDRKFIETRIKGGINEFNLFKKSVSKYSIKSVSHITGIDSSLIERAVEIYANSDKVMLASGMGISQQLNGTDTVSSILNLFLITGKIGKKGCGLNPPRGQNNVQGASDVGCLPMSYPGYAKISDNNRKRIADIWGVPYTYLPDKMGLSTVEIIKAANKKDIRAMYIMGENPILSDPNINHAKLALKKLDFLVVQDIFLTETAKYADVVFPATSFAEKNGTFTNSDRRVSRVRKVTSPPGEAKQDWIIVSSVAKKMGYSLGDYENESDIFNEICLAVPFMSGINYEKIKKEGIQWPCFSEKDQGSDTLFVNTFNTKDGLAVLNPIDYKADSENPDINYPFLLNSGRILNQYHTGTMSRKSTALNKYGNEPYVLINGIDAVKLDLKDKELVRIISKQGEIEVKIKISDKVKVREVFMPFHYFESPVNVLTRDELDPYSKIPAFKRTACRIESMR